MANETALVIIDMQHDFISLESPLCMREVSKIIPGIKALIAEARKKGWPVIYVARILRNSALSILKNTLFA